MPSSLTVTPSKPYFNFKVSGEKSVVVLVGSTEPDFLVHSAKIIEGPLVAKVLPRDREGRYAITVSVVPSK